MKTIEFETFSFTDNTDKYTLDENYQKLIDSINVWYHKMQENLEITIVTMDMEHTRLTPRVQGTYLFAKVCYIVEI